MIPEIVIIVTISLLITSSFFMGIIEEEYKIGLTIFIISILLTIWLSLSNYNSEFEVTSMNTEIVTVEKNGLASQYYMQNEKLYRLTTQFVLNPNDYVVKINKFLPKIKYGIIWSSKKGKEEVTLVKKTNE